MRGGEEWDDRMHAYTHTCIRAPRNMYIYIYIHIYVYMCTGGREKINNGKRLRCIARCFFTDKSNFHDVFYALYMRGHARVYVHIYERMRARKCVCVCVCMCMCVCVCVCVGEDFLFFFPPSDEIISNNKGGYAFRTIELC